jgi:hypothetical protein
MITETRLVKITESSIDSLIVVFMGRPYSFYPESDFHCYLYHESTAGFLLMSGYARPKTRSQAFYCIKNIQPKRDTVQKT